MVVRLVTNRSTKEFSVGIVGGVVDLVRCHDQHAREEERLHDDVSGVCLEATLFRKQTCDSPAEQGNLLTELTVQHEQAQQMKRSCGERKAVPVSRAPFLHFSVLSLPEYCAIGHRVRTF